MNHCQRERERGRYDEAGERRRRGEREDEIKRKASGKRARCGLEANKGGTSVSEGKDDKGVKKARDRKR